jgi:protein-S-isoprenylcysteine O-methyltransferase Ste14
MTTNDNENTSPSRKWRTIGRIRSAAASAIGYMLPLIMSAPGLYLGFMTLPFLAYFIMLLAGLPLSLESIPYLVFGGSTLENLVIVLGLIIFLYSVIYLWRTKSRGLVMTGPYRVVRHPQYLSLMIFTAVLTSRSVWVIQNTFGSVYLGQWETILLWFLVVFVYIGLGLFEEQYLAIRYQEDWTSYRRRVGFFLPFIADQRRRLEIAISVIILAGLMMSLLFFNDTLSWFL